MMGKPGVMLYFDIRPCLKRLSAEEKGLLFEAILEYGANGTEPGFDGMLGIAWDFIQPVIDRDSDRYDHQVSQKRFAAYVREAKRKGLESVSFDDWCLMDDITRHQLIPSDTERHPTTTTSPITTTATSPTTTNKADKPPSRHKFSPPTVEDIKAYCRENGYMVDAERFVDHYASNGWMVGKNKMKDWKAAVRNWSRKDKVNNGKTGSEQVWAGIGTQV